MSVFEPTAIARVDDKRDPETYAIIGAAIEVHRVLGAGFLEAVYQQSLAIEFNNRQIPFQRELGLQLKYKSQSLDCTYRADFVCFAGVLVEIKALAHLGPAERAQIINYLKATGLNRGLLLNFGSGRLEFERFVWTSSTAPSDSSALSADPLSVPTFDLAESIGGVDAQ